MRLLSIHSVDTAAAQAGSLVNRLSPLDRLADDILSLVLQQLDNRTIFFAAKVSRRWRALSLSIPSLWANIDMSCRPPDRHMQKDQFQRRFQLLVERSKGAPLDIKLVMESTEVQSLYDRDDVEDEYVHELLLQECELDLEQQFESGVKLLALAPDVIARIRTLDITSMLDTFHRRFWSSGRVQQPTQQLQLPIAPALRHLRLNWARPETQKLELVLPPDLCAFGSVSSLSLCAVPNLQAILPRFSGVTDLSLRMVDEDEGIELADICAWMPKLETLEIVDVFDNFAFKSLTSHPSLKRLALHGELTSFAFPMVAKQLNPDAIPEISIWNIGAQPFESAVIPEAATATAELSLSAQPCETGLRGQKLTSFRLHHFCAEDGSGRRHVVHSKHVNDCEPEIATFTTINANMRAFNEMLLDTMPRLTTLRIRTMKNSVHGVQSRRDDPARLRTRFPGAALPLNQQCDRPLRSSASSISKPPAMRPRRTAWSRSAGRTSRSSPTAAGNWRGKAAAGWSIPGALSRR